MGKFDIEESEALEQVTISLEMEDDTTLECAALAIFELDGQDYIAMTPVDEQDTMEDIFILRYSEDEEGNAILDNIESDEEYEKAADRFDEILDEYAEKETE